MPIDIALLILRVALGLVFVAHGVKHARGREKTSNWFGSIGFRQPQMQWFASSATEIGVGVLLGFQRFDVGQRRPLSFFYVLQ